MKRKKLYLVFLACAIAALFVEYVPSANSNQEIWECDGNKAIVSCRADGTYESLEIVGKDYGYHRKKFKVITSSDRKCVAYFPHNLILPNLPSYVKWKAIHLHDDGTAIISDWNDAKERQFRESSFSEEKYGANIGYPPRKQCGFQN